MTCNVFELYRTISNLELDDTQDKGEEDEEESTTPVVASSTARKRKAKVDPVDKALLDLLQQQPKDVSSPQKDEDRGFFLSLYKDFRSLPSVTKLYVKMQLMQVTIAPCSEQIN